MKLVFEIGTQLPPSWLRLKEMGKPFAGNGNT